MPQWIVIFNVIATCLWSFQIVFAFLLFRQTKRWRKRTLDHTPKLSVVIPSYNETNSTIQKVVDSVIMQQKVEVEVFVVDDGSDFPLQIQEHSKIKLLRSNTNQGKRAAQIYAIRQASYDWIVTVDSDTILQPNALYRLYQSAIENKWDAVTGHVKLLNDKRNLLTRMITCLYWYGFCQERASQGFFGQVTCCSGALSLWRKETILATADLYLNQQFMGKNCVAGDDRYLTCLFALHRKRVGCSIQSVAYTISPSTLGTFAKQQLRWARSNTPALVFALKNFSTISPLFIAFMLAVVFRYSYFAVLYVCVILAIGIGFYWAPVHILLTILVVSGLKATNAFVYTRDWKMFYLMPLSLLSFCLFSPIIIYGALTPSATGWLTRVPQKRIWSEKSQNLENPLTFVEEVV